MFAYVIYDKLKDKLTIVNDVQGEKNLYYYDDDNILIISYYKIIRLSYWQI
mgnify:CR=1 FL=1